MRAPKKQHESLEVDRSSESYGQILSSSALIGGSQVLVALFGIVRMKFIAMMVGPLGMGLLGSYQSIQGLVGTVAGLGIQSSAVRSVAQVEVKEDDQIFGILVQSIYRVCWLTGVIGMMSLVGLALPISQFTFGTDEYAMDVALLGIVVLLSNLAGGQLAIIQGTRRISDLSKLNVISALFGTLFAIVLYAWLGLRGIVPSLVFLALTQLIAARYFVRRIEVPKAPTKWKESFSVVKDMLPVGIAFMWSSFLVALVALLTRAWINQEIGLFAVGIFGAAFSLSGFFVNFVISAMGVDYYPRLTSIAPDRVAMGKLVNEQTEIGLLLAVPALLGMISLAPWVIRLFFSVEFLPAADLFQWFVLGCLGRVISFPMGFIMLAMGKSQWFFITETIFNSLHLMLIWLGLTNIGLEGVAGAFLALYVLYTVGVYRVSFQLIGFSWTRNTWRLIGILLPLVISAFLAERILSGWPALGVGFLLTAFGSIICLRGLILRIGNDHVISRFANLTPGLQRIAVSKEYDQK